MAAVLDLAATRTIVTKQEGPLDSQKIRASTNERRRAAGATPGAPFPPVLLPQGERPVAEVIERALSLGLVALAAEGFDPALVHKDVSRFRLANAMTPLETSCVASDGTVDMNTRSNLSWDIEASRALAWALGLELALPPVDDEESQGFMALGRLLDEGSVEALVSKAAPRAREDVVAEADFYRCYRAIYQELIPPDAPPGADPQEGTLGAQAVRNRARAFEWLLDPTSAW